jgi:hypothetical protein
MPSFKKADARDNEAKLRHVHYMFGARGFVFHGTFTLGGETVSFDMPVPTEFLRRLGANLNDPRIENTPTRDGNGHALWHVEHPDSEIPCWSCSDEGKRLAESRYNAIDVEPSPPKLPSGGEPE